MRRSGGSSRLLCRMMTAHFGSFGVRFGPVSGGFWSQVGHFCFTCGDLRPAFMPVTNPCPAAVRASPPVARPREGVSVSGPDNRHRRARMACHFLQPSRAAQQIISRRHSKSSGRPPRAEERRSAGGPPRHQLRPRGAPLRPDSTNGKDRGSTNNRGGQGHTRGDSSSNTSTVTSSGSSPAARGQPQPAAASSTATQTSDPTVETTNHQTSSTHAERARRWRQRVSPYGRATRHGGPGVGRSGGYE